MNTFFLVLFDHSDPKTHFKVHFQVLSFVLFLLKFLPVSVTGNRGTQAQIVVRFPPGPFLGAFLKNHHCILSYSDLVLVDNMSVSFDYFERHSFFRTTGTSRWFTAEEILELILNYDSYGFTKGTVPPSSITNGDIYIFDRQQTKHFKADGVDWIKKKGLDRVREDFQKINIDGVHRITGFYTHSSNDPTFKRRCYRESSEGSNLYVVHYRYDDGKRRQSGDSSIGKNPSTMIDSSSMKPFDSTESYSTGNKTLLKQHSPASTSSPVQPYTPITTIIDFSPNIYFGVDNRKILVALSQPVPTNQPLFVSFGGTFAPAEALQPTILRCEAPLPYRTGGVWLFISNGIGQISPNCAQQYIYPSLVHPPLPPPALNSAPKSSHDIYRSGTGEHFPVGIKTDVSSKRQTQIHLVERLGFMHDEWLNDNTLSSLPDHELSNLMEQYVMSVVQMLVEATSVEEDLIKEFDELDRYGYNLLHYCCLFHEPSLIAVLLSRGINTNTKSSNGDSPLHMAANIGSVSICKVLLQHSADVFCLDANDMYPHQIAKSCDKSEAHQYLFNYGSSIKTCPVDFYHDPEPRLSDTDTFSMLPLSRLVSHDWPLEENELDEMGSLSSQFFKDMFDSLSLSDKCALNLSMSSSLPLVPDSLSPPSRSSSRRPSINSLTPFDDDFDRFDMQSVLSETDKEGLDQAMKFMGAEELQEIESEATIIQNNVRAWLLRKNYRNLRDAALTLQGAWRERKKSRISVCAESDKTVISMELDEVEYQGGGSSSGSGAAATVVQAATRRMIARNVFIKLRKEAINTLLVVKSKSLT